jgi:calcineurin-like phosphoesterase family protein
MNYWLITDTHFGHDMLVLNKYRPMNFEYLILKNSKSIIKDDDIVIHLGDLGFYDIEKWNNKFIEACGLAKRWLVRGNHDKKTNHWFLTHGWDCVCYELVIDLFGKKILFSHRPVLDRDDFDINIHGHCHDMNHHDINLGPKNKLIFIEHTYQPINLRFIIDNWKMPIIDNV